MSNVRIARVVALLTLAGCAPAEVEGPSGSGGTTGSGGQHEAGGSGGGVGSGGATGTPGSTGGTGSPATGGSIGTGGAIASGGTTNTGGATGSGGTPSTGGATGSGGVNAGGATGTGGRAGAGGNVGGRGGSGTGGRGGSGLGGTGGPSTGGRGGAGQGGAGAGAYQPCPTDGNPCKVLPFGDSITWGVADEANAGYRGPLFALAVAAQQKITFTGSVSNGPSTVSGQTFPKKNEGHSGWTISTVVAASGSVAGIAALIPSPAFDSGSGGVPNVILLMIGTNDTNTATAAQMTDRLSALIDKIVAAAPNALLVVAKITPLSWATSVINPYNAAIPGLVQTRAAAGKHVVLADMNSGFNTSTMMSSDNIHPNSAGYKFMADRWYSVVGPLFPK